MMDDPHPPAAPPATAERQSWPAADDTAHPPVGDRPAHDIPPVPRKRVFLIAGLLVLALLAYGAYAHWRQYADAAETQQQTIDFVPTVRAVEAKSEDAAIDLTLPGQTEAFDTASIYARATGYIAERRVDIGSRINKGDLLVRIVAPDLDQQLAQGEAQLGQFRAAVTQAQANLQSAQANTKLADVTKYRQTTLAGQGWETKQNADNSTANAAVQVANVASAQAGIGVADANLKAQQATVDRLRALTAFEQVTAPFSGVVTARNVDVGDLVSADSSSGTPMFSMNRDDVLRVSVNVPQSGAVGMRDGLEGKVSVPEIPGRVFAGKVARSSVALMYSSRTLLTEVDVANPDHTLRPGLYVNVSFAIPREHPGVTVPDEALVFNQSGMQVAVLAPDQTIRMRKVSIYRDFGTSVELRDGVSGGERVVLSPPVDLHEGSKVKLADDPDAHKKPPDQPKEAQR